MKTSLLRQHVLSSSIRRYILHIIINIDRFLELLSLQLTFSDKLLLDILFVFFSLVLTTRKMTNSWPFLVCSLLFLFSLLPLSNFLLIIFHLFLETHFAILSPSNEFIDFFINNLICLWLFSFFWDRRKYPGILFKQGLFKLICLHIYNSRFLNSLSNVKNKNEKNYDYFLLLSFFGRMLFPIYKDLS